MTEQLKVTLTPITSKSLNTIEEYWLTLEKIANNSIFTHWYFIQSWIRFINYQGKLLKITFKDDIVGLAILSDTLISKNGLRINQLWLNRTGDEKLDQIWNEYNDILCVKDLEYSIRAAVINYFNNELTDFDELIIGVSDVNIKETPRPDNIMQYTSWEAISYQTTLKSNYKDWLFFLKTLSANSRAQIKKSARLFGGKEKITLTSAKSVDEALTFLTATGELHKARWVNKNSGFENNKFVEFHQQFIKQNFHLNLIDILKIESRNETICYLYNFLYKNTVYFYLSGIRYSTDNRLKPGLLAHSLAISHYAKLGYETYDFMGGEGRYKKSLSDKTGILIVSNFRRKTLPFIASRAIRKIKALCA